MAGAVFRVVCFVGVLSSVSVLPEASETRGAGEFCTELPLPPLLIEGKPAKAHTQGIWIRENTVYVTARRDDISPRRALLLRAKLGSGEWDVWDITPQHHQGRAPKSVLDHPGGMDSDGTRLWIPVAESHPGGKTQVQVHDLSHLEPGRPPAPVQVFVVDDHIGALAVSRQRRELFGASWDTRDVYIWDLGGTLKKRLSAVDLAQLGLGVEKSPPARVGLAVQDWKIVGERLFASGLFKGTNSGAQETASRLYVLDIERFKLRRSILLPHVRKGVRLAGEGMAIAGGSICFLPEDLDGKNRLFQFSLEELLERENKISPERIPAW